MEHKVIVGIDLGTTLVPRHHGGRRRGGRLQHRGAGPPSVVAFTEDGERLVGQIARRQAITNPGTPCSRRLPAES